MRITAKQSLPTEASENLFQASVAPYAASTKNLLGFVTNALRLDWRKFNENSSQRRCGTVVILLLFAMVPTAKTMDAISARCLR
jgi:hypothetical protein